MKHLSTLLRGGLSAALLLLLWLAGPAARAQAPAWQMAIVANSSTNSIVSFAPTVTDAAGNVYVAGSFFSTVSFGSITLTSRLYRDMFVAKWSPVTQDFIWVQQAFATTYVEPSRLAVSGNCVYVTGTFYYTATFGNTSLTTAGTAASSSAFDTDIFVAKILDGGTSASWAWAKRAGGIANDQATGLALSGTSVYVAGRFAGTADFGSTVLTSADLTDGFVAKLTDAGNTAAMGWVLPIGGHGYNNLTTIANSGTNLYAAGSFSGTVSFGAFTITSAGLGDVFVARLIDNGGTASIAWVNRAGGPGGGGSATAIVCNNAAVYVAGNFGGAAISFGNTVLAPATTSSDMFVAKLSDGGTSSTFTWALRAGGSSDDAVTDIAAKGNSLFAVGYFKGTATFGSATLTSAGNNDGYLAKLTDGGLTGSFAWVQSMGGTRSDYCNGVTVAGSAIYTTCKVSTPATLGPLVISAPAAGTDVGFLTYLTDPTLLATTAAQSSLSFALAPNPARTAATLTLPALPGTATATLTLRDALGRTLRTETISLPAAGLRHSLDLTGLAPGLYAVQVRAGSTAGTQRLVVE